MTHTPSPWFVSPSFRGGQAVIHGPKQHGQHRRVAACGSPRVYENKELDAEVQANAAMIVKAVNCHAELVDALSKCEALLAIVETGVQISGSMVSAAVATARATLEKANG